MILLKIQNLNVAKILKMYFKYCFNVSLGIS
ncbi:hypothetical protein BkAM31D_06350 [Halalkalibacter krulwichiae]|uniref:Uncharacterized protein n=1 Tax=Halalkalibacter krulwichiae TaxID=199441 RepID=A0A1X9M7V4_9BACI|nr:hypothetical protein BkAM31D_06350 [Halalkalibacter krulwichiae]